MPRYFFHVIDGKAGIDSEGTELDSLAEARREAVEMAGITLAQDSSGLASGQPWQMSVVDASGDVVFSLKFEADHHGF